MSKKKYDNKTEVVRFRCTPEQKEQIKALALTLGISVSELLLGMALGDKLGQIILPGQDN